MRLSAFSAKVARRYLWCKRSEAFIRVITIISVLGVAIGVAVLNLVMAIMTGFQQELQDKIVGANSHVIVRRIGDFISDWPVLEERIKSVPGVVSVSPFTHQQGLLRYNDRSSGILIRGVQQNSSGYKQLADSMENQEAASLFQPAPVLVDHPEEGTQEAHLPGIVVGQELARQMGIFVGSVVSLMASNVSSTPFGLLPRFRRFVVVGTYSSLVDFESSVAYMSLEESQRFFRLGDNITGLEVQVSDIDHAPKMAREIIDAVGNLSQGLYAQDWTESNRALWDALKLEKKVYFLVLLLIIVMASFSIVSSLVMIVLEKRKDIAILRTMGASERSIRQIFVTQGAIIGALGTSLGIILGIIGCVALDQYGFPLDQRIFPVDRVPVYIDWMNFVLTAICAFLICLMATIYPARKASRLEPCQILRYE